MARSLLAELVVALRDGVSGPAKNLINSLKGVETAVGALGKKGNAQGINQMATSLDKAAASARMLAAEGTKLADWGSAFQKQIAKMKLSAADLDRVKQSWRELNRELAGTDKAFRSTAIANWKNEIRTWALGIDAANRSMRGLSGSAAAARREMAALSNLTRTLGFGGMAYAMQVGGRAAGRAAFDYRRQVILEAQGGISPNDSALLSAKAIALSRKYQSVDATTMRKHGQEAYNLTGDMPKALDLLDPMARARVVLQNVKGVGEGERELGDLIKGFDVFDKQESLESMKYLIDMAVKSTQVEGRQLSLTEYLRAAKYAKAAGPLLSDEFIGAVLPTMGQAEGGQRSGTMIASSVSQNIANRITRRAMRAQQDAGIRGQGPNGQIVDPDLMMRNPYDWAHKYLTPALQKKGIDPKNHEDVLKFVSTMFSNQMVQNMFTKFFTGQAQIDRNRNILYPKAKGISDEAVKLAESDPYVAIEKVFAQLRNLFGTLGEAGATDAIVSFLGKFAGAIAQLNQLFQENAIAANIASGLMSIAGGLIALRLSIAAWRLLGIPGMFGGGAAAAAAGAGAGAAGVGAGAAAGAGAAGIASRLALIARMSPYAMAIGGAWDGLRVIREANEASLGGVAPGEQHNRGILMRRRANELLRQQTQGIRDATGMPSIGSSGTTQFGLGGFAPRIDVDQFVKVDEAAKNTRASIESIGETSVRPKIDMAEIDAAQSKVDRLRASLQQIGNEAAAIGRRVEQSVQTAMRASYSDIGTGGVEV
jgi:hypothetical protein